MHVKIHLHYVLHTSLSLRNHATFFEHSHFYSNAYETHSYEVALVSRID